MPLGAARFGLLGGLVAAGSLELIESQSITSSTSTMNFTSIKEDEYDVHLLQYKAFYYLSWL